MSLNLNKYVIIRDQDGQIVSSYTTLNAAKTAANNYTNQTNYSTIVLDSAFRYDVDTGTRMIDETAL